MENTKITYFLRPVEFWPTFDIQISITLAIFRKSCKTMYFRKSLSKHANILINKATHYKIIALEENEIFVFLAALSLK